MEPTKTQFLITAEGREEEKVTLIISSPSYIKSAE